MVAAQGVGPRVQDTEPSPGWSGLERLTCPTEQVGGEVEQGSFELGRSTSADFRSSPDRLVSAAVDLNQERRKGSDNLGTDERLGHHGAVRHTTG